ncbi:Hsp33 family molecular chaperone HslO [Verticiella sediminum]|uniref:33 kDa chaperonin n=1 Tax=Verticiella sediminum TaxID=1247510 RepID=A0A556A986_9BURK|nr:Hsp33 family molecular chaperone HslO [Verticiella sediminum]TSH89431.1 Hsp33 family molecular chaperone HslO [Verticiella sediminum]
MSDQLTKYLFADQSVRLETVTLENTWRDIQGTHDYPPAVRRLLGDLVAASALLSANLKFDGSLVMQIQGDGDVRLVVVECRANLEMRATVKMREGASFDDAADLQALVNPGGKGRFIVVLDPRGRQAGQQPYQGVVPLQGTNVAEALEHYMAASEQLQTRLWLATDDHRAAGLLLQRLAREGGKPASEGAVLEEDTWERAEQLAQTIKQEELLTLTAPTLVHRLFWEEDLTMFEPMTPRFHCGCSREKVADALRMLGVQEVESILEEQGRVEVKCDYCGAAYHFDAVDAAELFANDNPVQARHQSSSTH